MIGASLMCMLHERSLSVQARRQGGVRGGSLEPPFWPPKVYMHCLTVHFKYATVCNWSTSFDAIENQRRPNKSGVK